MNHRDVAKALNIIGGFPNAREWTDEEKIQRGFSTNDICGPCGEFKIAKPKIVSEVAEEYCDRIEKQCDC